MPDEMTAITKFTDVWQYKKRLNNNCYSIKHVSDRYQALHKTMPAAEDRSMIISKKRKYQFLITANSVVVLFIVAPKISLPSLSLFICASCRPLACIVKY